MFWRIEDREKGAAKTLMQARAKLNSDGLWGLDSTAVEAINGVMLGVRQGWCLQVEVEGDDEVLFLRGMETFLAAMEPLGLHAEPGFFINRKRISPKNIVPEGTPFVTHIPISTYPVEYVHRAVIAITTVPHVASAMLDSYAIAVAGRGRFFDCRAWLPPANIREETVKLATILGVPQAVLDHRFEHYPQGIMMTLNNAHQLRGRHDLPDWTSQLFWSFEPEWEDPFDLDQESVSRDQAVHSMTILEAGPTWTPDGWNASKEEVGA